MPSIRLNFVIMTNVTHSSINNKSREIQKYIFDKKKTFIFLSYSEDCVFVAGRRGVYRKNCDSAHGFNPLFPLPTRQFSFPEFLFLRQDSLLLLLSPHSKLAKGIKFPLIFFSLFLDFIFSFSHSPSTPG